MTNVSQHPAKSSIPEISEFAIPLRVENSAISGAVAGAVIGVAILGPIGAVLGAATFAVLNTVASGAGKALVAQFKATPPVEGSGAILEEQAQPQDKAVR